MNGNRALNYACSHGLPGAARWLVAAFAVVVAYGVIQYLDTRLFPPGAPELGLDKFVWRRAFGERVFSTFGNPNFYSNFLVIMIPVLSNTHTHTQACKRTQTRPNIHTRTRHKCASIR